MSSSHLVGILSYLEPVFCALVLAALIRSKVSRAYVYLAGLLAVRLSSDIICLVLLRLAGRGIERHTAYATYFYTYWAAFALEAVLSLLTVLGVFRLAMEPLKGLQTLGMLVFRWAAAISIAVAIAIAVAPHQSGTAFMVAMVTQLQQTSSVLTLCLLLFVCFAIRPMGLSFRSRIFGVSLGLGMMAATSLIAAAWLSRNSQLYSKMNAVQGLVGCLTLLIWSTYFTLPEEKRRIIVLPTTSPFLRWNQISEVLGDEPGYVAIAGIPPEVFAPAEIEVMRRASAKMPNHVPEPSAVALKSLTA